MFLYENLAQYQRNQSIHTIMLTLKKNVAITVHVLPHSRKHTKNFGSKQRFSVAYVCTGGRRHEAAGTC